MKIIKYLFQTITIFLLIFITSITAINLSDYINSANIMGIKDFIIPIIGHVIAILVLIFELIFTFKKQKFNKVIVILLTLVVLTAVGLGLPIGWGPGLLNYNFIVLGLILILKIIEKKICQSKS
ncbi:hypothetical protein [Lactobacillus sp. PSON]|uniref:hypothetical protein n=1 Tax=Lactobacillus sp. PSON TaxID=3455454 RepID=UPI004041F029